MQPSQRIATFDNDGTLWVEQPIYVQLAFAIDRQAVLIRSLSEREAFGFGARLVAPTASDDIGNGKWKISRFFVL